MSEVFKIGAPSKGSLAVLCAALTFPAMLTMENHVRRLVLPSAGVDLEPDYVRGDSLPTVVMHNADDMQRLVTDIEQLSELNGWEHAVTITYDAIDMDTDVAKAEAEAKAAAEAKAKQEASEAAAKAAAEAAAKSGEPNGGEQEADTSDGKPKKSKG